jgi:hypothetical protein
MKAVKYVLTVVVIMFCFVLGSELYQSHLQTFSNQFYFIEIENDDRSVVYSAVISAVEQYGEDVFAVERKDIDAFHSEIIIYATAGLQEKLASDSIVEGDARSLFSGTTEVVIFPFEEVVENSDVTRYYFTGSKKTVSSIRQSIYSRIATSYIHKESITGNESLIYGVWIFSFGFLLLLTWLDIQFNRKSDFLKISLGGSVGRIVGCNILSDTVFNFAAIGAVCLFLGDKISISYKLDFVLGAFFIFSILNALLYFTLFKCDYKEILYGANINGKLLSNAYLLKAVVMIMLIISLTCNLTVIVKNADVLKAYSRIDKLQGYNTLVLTADKASAEDPARFDKVKTQLFMDAYLQGRVLLSSSCAKLDEDEPIIVINDAALDTVVSNPEYFENRTSTFVVYIPENKTEEMDEEDIEFAAGTTASNYFGLEEYSFDVMTYTHTNVVYFDLRKESELSYGFEMLSDPVIVYCNVSAAQINELLDEEKYVEFGDRWQNIIFDLQDTSFFPDNILSDIGDVDFQSVVGQCDQYKSSLVRTVFLNSILSAFLLLLSLLLISVIVKIEYLINAKEIALKKILGYSIFRRNMGIILLNAFAVWIAFITGFIFSNMYSVFRTSTLCRVSLCVFVIDTILIMGNMSAAENKNTAHVLKGGSL